MGSVKYPVEHMDAFEQPRATCELKQHFEHLTTSLKAMQG